MELYTCAECQTAFACRRFRVHVAASGSLCWAAVWLQYLHNGSLSSLNLRVHSAFDGAWFCRSARSARRPGPIALITAASTSSQRLAYRLVSPAISPQCCGFRPPSFQWRPPTPESGARADWSLPVHRKSRSVVRLGTPSTLETYRAQLFEFAA